MRQLEAESDDPAFFLIPSLRAVLYLLIAVTWLAVLIGIANSKK